MRHVRYGLRGFIAAAGFLGGGRSGGYREGTGGLKVELKFDVCFSTISGFVLWYHAKVVVTIGYSRSLLN